MESVNLKLYQKLHSLYKEINVNKKHNVIDDEVSVIWKNLKQGSDFPENAKQEIVKLTEKAAAKRSSLLKYWGQASKKKFQSEKVNQPGENNEPRMCQPNVGSIATSVEAVEATSSVAEVVTQSVSKKTPVQDAIRKSILHLQQDVEYLVTKKNSGIATDNQLAELSQKRADLKKQQTSLNNLIQTQDRQKKSREKRRQILLENPEIREKLNYRAKKGRIRIEDEQPGLLKAIIDIATYGSGAEERRRSDLLRTCKSLDDLRHELTTLGYNISRSALYLRLQPRRVNTIEGKRHVVTVPVKLIRSRNDAHKSHSDTLFCKASISYLEEIASILGGHNVIFISQDDKARIPLGITAANKQAPLLMHMDYRVRLPDHDWVVAEKHKLIPSVYGIMEIKNGEANAGDSKSVGYSGPTFIAIRSGKHCSSNIVSHAKDFDALMNLEDCYSFTRNACGDIKPVVIMIADGGPDENPRYEKVINCAIRHCAKSTT